MISGTGVAAQDAQAPATIFRAETDLVVIEAHVTDRARRSMTGLTADDFTVRIDGEPRRVVAAEYVARKIDRVERSADAPDGAFTHVSSILVPPGRYQLRAAMVDEQGHGGSVDHALSADLPAAGPIRTSDLVVGYLEGTRIDPALDASLSDTIAAVVGLYSSEATGSPPDVNVTLHEADSGRAVATTRAEIRDSGLSGVAQAVATFAGAELAAGEYLVRAEVRAGDGTSRLPRSLLVHRAPRTADADGASQCRGRCAPDKGRGVRRGVPGALVERRDGRSLQTAEAPCRPARGPNTPVGRSLVSLPGGAVTGFRDVFEVDGRAVHNRDERLRRLFIEQQRDSAVAQARRIAQESSRYNLGSAVRTLNLPSMPLQFLLPAHRSRIRFDLKDERTILGRRMRRVGFREIGSPTLVRTPGGDEIRMTGEFWIEPQSGEVWRADASFELWLDRRLTRPALVGDLVVTFAPNEKLGALVPDRMVEQYRLGSGEENDATATYSSFRLFVVRTQERIPPPPLR